ncbi:MAG: electron transfer flavoprotein subunit alpha [Pseudomonadota bacterium]
MIVIDSGMCNGCALCRKSCPFGAITLVDGCAVVGDACTLCGSCAGVCPQQAISIPRRVVPEGELAGYRGVMVFAECGELNGRLAPRRFVTELVTKGRELADKLGQELLAVALGDDRLTGLEELGRYGVDRVLKCAHSLLKDFSADGFCAVLSAVTAEIKPSVLLYGATPNGRELAPRVAARLRLGLTADCTGLDIDDNKRLVQTRPAFGGNIMASIVSPRTRPQTATVRPNVFPAQVRDPAGRAIVQDRAVMLNPSMIRTRIVDQAVITDQEGPGLEEAGVVVAAGRGCSTASGLETAGLLADRLGGILACTRPLVEDGLLPHTRQVGQSGFTVGPDLYLALGISGAVQHRVGMGASKTIIVVNKDPESAMFDMADLGVVGDAPAIAAALVAALDGRTPG